MASGDANRTWFPEMISMLKTDWHAQMSWEEIIQFRDRLDETLQEIRTTRNIQPAMMWCSKCQTRHRSAPPKVSVRALILALSRFQVEEEEMVKKIEKEWKVYKSNNGLDLYGESEDGITNVST